MLAIVNKTIEHKVFKPVAVSIIITFLLFRGFEFSQSFVTDYREKSVKNQLTTPMKINISGVNLDIDENQIVEYRIKQGDTILKILVDLGAEEKDIFAILSAMKKVFSPVLISSGSQIEINFQTKISYNADNLRDNIERKVIINSIAINKSFDERIVVSRKSSGDYDSREIKVKLLRYVSKYSGIIENGLFVDGVASGVSPNSMMNMINLYGYDVDFQRDIHSGDKFEILVESFYDEKGKKVKDGNVIFSSLTLRNRAIDIYMHKIGDRIEYFDAKGGSIKKSLLRTPINGARISSGFGLRRHPILGYSKMHKGTDFAAAKGTPIMAAGNGTIAYMAVKGGYGNYVQIKHNSEYSTAYGHASRFNRKFRVGSKVKQGDIVAYVGSTGRSTGPHLHFEVLYRGNQINPAKVKATSGLRLGGKELARFEVTKAETDKYRKTIKGKTAK